ncbi:RNA polymerase sigma factor FliA [Wenzhouxiangella sp. AB-CW3]|uniref:RNA polymerase sigma factor FliA n=1 Tax=Wenzhouxiangella sp. AB-CW3 TaxID=2771012 RepID=UPI00168C0DD3|nr:RNA polymerase sigma factor FliA [Wenzhouxiangella sp. AB-CW3]QOC21188.1 RNA polymerase sigma factor FliA [Wenzhouxiangella sp. AB-CW3]
MNSPREYLEVQRLDQDDLVERYAHLVRRIAYHLVGRLPASVEVNDLMQAGMIGLIEAAGKYTGDRGASFETYAGIRIRGAMLDELRRTDWVPRSVHRKVRDMVETIRQLEARLGRRVRDTEIAEEMGLGLDEYHRIAAEAATCRMFSMDELSPVDSEESPLPGDEKSPEEGLEAQDIEKALAHAIETLPDREKLVMSLYYSDELNLREIGEVMGVSESRICQLHGQSLARLRADLADLRS